MLRVAILRRWFALKFMVVRVLVELEFAPIQIAPSLISSVVINDIRSSI